MRQLPEYIIICHWHQNHNIHVEEIGCLFTHAFDIDRRWTDLNDIYCWEILIKFGLSRTKIPAISHENLPACLRAPKVSFTKYRIIFLSCPLARYLFRDISADAGLLCDNAVVLDDTIKRTVLIHFTDEYFENVLEKHQQVLCLTKRFLESRSFRDN